MFNDVLQQFQYYDKYSRYDYDLGRREHWPETVARTISYMKEEVAAKKKVLPNLVWDELESAILNLEIMPSMRNLAMAGPAARRQNACTYNCSYMPIKDVYSFFEAVIILMNGSGLGYSVEYDYIEKLPGVEPQSGNVVDYVVPDTTEGWATAIHHAIDSWFKGYDIDLDYSNIRPAGTPLRIKGGRASGAKHLSKAIKAMRRVILAREGKRLRSIDIHDLMCYIAEAIVSGGVRRSAMIALFSKSDKLMIDCKSGDNLTGNEQRWFANNSVVVEERMTKGEVIDFMNVMYDSGRGEPGIFSRYAASTCNPKRRKAVRFGTNPCGEILLRPYSFCNLTSVVCRPNDTKDDILEKVRLATILGTIQSMADHFPGLREEWSVNAREERLLGVDLNGIMDCPTVRDADTLAEMREYAVAVNEQYAGYLGINPSAAITTVKPSGNSSTMLDTSPGLHTRWSPYYIRRAQVMAESPLRHIMQKAGLPIEPRSGSTEENATTWVVSFPVKAPDGAITRKDLSAVEQCNYWKLIKVNYTEHNPSVTITFHPHEQEELTAWVYENQDIVGGMAFLPFFDADYAQLPYEVITESEYIELSTDFPVVDWKQISTYENGSDMTNVSQVYACDSDKCIVLA